MLSMSVFAYFPTNSTHIRQSLERLCHFWDPHSILNQKISLLLFLLLHSWFLRAKTALKMPSMVVFPCFSNFSTQYGQLYPILMSFLESSFNFRWKKHLSCFFSRFILDFCEPNYQKQPINATNALNMQLRDEKKWVSGCFWEVRTPFMISVGHEEHISKPVLQILGTFFRYYFFIGFHVLSARFWLR